jgi:hypothetical protein
MHSEEFIENSVMLDMTYLCIFRFSCISYEPYTGKWNIRKNEKSRFDFERSEFNFFIDS